MKTTKSSWIALFGALLVLAGSVAARAQATQQAGDQSQVDPSTAKKDKKETKAGAADKSAAVDSSAASKKTISSKPSTSAAAPGGAPASKTTTAQKSPPASGAGMVWVNTDSGVYHKPGTRWYGKTKKGKYMTEADAIKAGYHAAKKE
jgi:hypothetical protein